MRHISVLTSRAAIVTSALLPLATLSAASGDVPLLEADAASRLWRLFPSLPVRAVFMFLALGVFILMAGVIAWRQRESVLDTIEFEGRTLFKKAVIATIFLLAAAFLTMMVINNR
jgi:hypothetical protein